MRAAQGIWLSASASLEQKLEALDLGLAGQFLSESEYSVRRAALAAPATRQYVDSDDEI